MHRDATRSETRRELKHADRAQAGEYDLSITHAARHIAGSPWRVRAMPGAAVAALCTVEGLPSSVVAGTTFEFTLATVDECRNATVSTNSVTAEVDSPLDGVVPLVVTEGGPGVHGCLARRLAAALACRLP